MKTIIFVLGFVILVVLTFNTLKVKSDSNELEEMENEPVYCKVFESKEYNALLVGLISGNRNCVLNENITFPFDVNNVTSIYFMDSYTEGFMKSHDIVFGNSDGKIETRCENNDDITVKISANGYPPSDRNYIYNNTDDCNQSLLDNLYTFIETNCTLIFRFDIKVKNPNIMKDGTFSIRRRGILSDDRAIIFEKCENIKSYNETYKLPDPVKNGTIFENGTIINNGTITEEDIINILNGSSVNTFNLIISIVMISIGFIFVNVFNN